MDILVLDDEATIRWVIEKTLADSGFNLHFAETAEEAARIVEKKPMDFALVDINLPGDDGLTFLRNQLAAHPGMLMAIITGQATMENAVAAMKLGAFDYLTKPFDIEEIETLVARAARAIETSRRQKTPPATPPRREAGGDAFIGKSRAVREIYKSIGRVAETDINVLILGESGTGKELIARSIHRHSGRAAEPFVAVNCAAIPRELLESELFGYEKGAFTGAASRRAGKLEAARRGTVFLDEIGDMAPELQAKVLRVLQEREFQRLGGVETIRLGARVITATNLPLEQAVNEGRFRADLFYRVSPFTIAVPPLRERREDIPPLVEHFLADGAAKLGLPSRGVTPEALERLTAHDWPGNVRELENVIRSLMIMTRATVIDVADLPRNLGGADEGAPVGEGFERMVLNQWGATIRAFCEGKQSGLLHQVQAHLERPLIRRVLHLTGGNQVRAAAVLGINRNTLRAKMRALGIRGKGRAEGPRRTNKATDGGISAKG
ncbi:MAG: sigma-54-dependent Fis family transcriptional regulator [SAR324 cluster bacterium]|nr:sigma-54-dependent Fis family transcriptional regulator [SAR324 cluster bacterium]